MNINSNTSLMKLNVNKSKLKEMTSNNSQQYRIMSDHLEFHRILREVLVGHEGRMLAAPLEQRGEPGLIL